MKKLFTLIFFCWACFTKCLFGQTKQITDSLKTVLEKHKNLDSNRVLLLVKYANSLFWTNPDSSIMVYAKEALHISKKINWPKGIARAYQLEGNLYQFIYSSPVSALDCYQKGLDANEYPNNREYKRYQGNTFINIGVVHYNLGEWQPALEYYEKGYAIKKEVNDIDGEEQVLMNIGSAFARLKQYGKAEENFIKSIGLAEKKGNISIVATSMASLGVVYKDMGKLKSSEEILEKCIKLAEENGISTVLPECLYNLAATQIELKEYASAERNGKKGLKLARQNDIKEYESGALEILGDLYSANGNYKEAVNYYSLYKPLHDSLLSSDKKRDVTKSEMRFEAEKKEAILNAEHTAELERQKLIRRNILAWAISVLLAAIIIFILYKRRQDAKTKQQEAEFKAKVSDTEMKALRAQMNPHFIFNSLNSINDYIDKQDAATATLYTTRFAKLMRMILENSEKKEVSLADDLKALELYLQLESLRLQNKMSYKITVDESIDAEETLVPPLMLQPFVENAVWHGLANKKEGDRHVDIRIEKRDNMLNCIIEDNGIGTKQSAAIKTNLGFSEKKSFGIKITKDRINILNQIKKTNAGVNMVDLQEGTRVEVVLPLELSF